MSGVCYFPLKFHELPEDLQRFKRSDWRIIPAAWLQGRSGASVSAEWLGDALSQLDEACRDAVKDGLPKIKDGARSNAEALIRRTSRHIDAAPIVYPTADAGVAVQFSNQSVDGLVVFIFDDDGQGACFYNIRDQHGRSRANVASEILDTAGWNCLRKLHMI